MEIPIDKAAVETAVAQAIVQSAIGDKIDKAVRDCLGKTWENPLDKAVEQVVREVALQQVRDLYSEKIAATIKAKLTDEAISAFVDSFWTEVFKRRT